MIPLRFTLAAFIVEKYLGISAWQQKPMAENGPCDVTLIVVLMFMIFTVQF
jgi:hypothetical protein